MGRAAFAIALATLVASLLAVVPAGAAPLRWRPCHEVQCARLTVPLDRGAPAQGSVSLAIQRRQARRQPSEGVTLLLAGGPGQAAIPAFSGRTGLGALFAPSRPYGEFARLTPRNDVVVFDQRGTGGSGNLRCRDLEAASGLDPGRAAEACATLLGPRRARYTTSDSVDDIEALRLALGGPKLTLLGVSYGTYVAQRYAIRYPQGVERMVLDSVVDTTGVDPLYRDTFAAVKRVLGQYCRRGCGFTRDPVADMATLVARLAEAPMRGTVGLPDGRRRQAALTRQRVLYSFVGGDLNPILRFGFPSAVASAVRGDPAPLLRLQRRSDAGERIGAAREFSTAVYAATACEETPFPYPREASLAPRAALALQAAEQAGPVFAPFDAFTAARDDLMRLCRRWPTSLPGPVIEPQQLPDVPTLLLAGGQDTRTPIETARRVLAQLPRGRLVVAKGSGHSVFGSGGCADRAVRRFLAGGTVPASCGAGIRSVARFVTPLAPLSLAEVQPLAGVPGKTGRILHAVLQTEFDAVLDFGFRTQVDPLAFLHTTHISGAGLRGGRFVVDLGHEGGGVLRLRRLEYLPGLRVSGTLRGLGGRRERGRLRIDGPPDASGFLRVGGGRVRGRLGGRPIRARGFGLLELEALVDTTGPGRRLDLSAQRRRALAWAGREPTYRDRTPFGLGDR